MAEFLSAPAPVEESKMEETYFNGKYLIKKKIIRTKLNLFIIFITVTSTKTITKEPAPIQAPKWKEKIFNGI